ncbi:ribonuclease H-like domain-containing protein [Tanacetum coccineum]
MTEATPYCKGYMRWVFKQDGSLSKYKARLVANRHNQQGIDCNETFSLVVKPATIHTVLSLAVSRDWPVHQQDVKNAFLHGHLSEMVYMHQPSTHPDYVCHWQCSLYALKQAPHAWFQCFASFAKWIGFQHSKIDTSLFIFHRGSDIAYLLLYVDDIILTASSIVILHYIIAMLHSEFDMIDLGSLNYFLGISAQRFASGMFLSYHSLNLLKKYLRRLRILCCVRGTIDHGLQLHVSSTTQLTAYTDAYLAGCPVTRDLLLGIVAESEYRSVANMVVEAAWICNLLRKVRVLHVASRFQYADIFTKGLPTALFLDFCSSLNVRRPPGQTTREY